MNAIDARLAELGIDLPTAMAPVANYVPYVVTGNLVVISGQLPAVDGKVAVVGKVGMDVSVEQGQHAARLCFTNVLTHLRQACGGDLGRAGLAAKAGGEENLSVFLGQRLAVGELGQERLEDVYGDGHQAGSTARLTPARSRKLASMA